MKTILFLCTAALTVSAQADFKPTIRRYDGMIGEKNSASLILHTAKDDQGEVMQTGSFHFLKGGTLVPLAAQPAKDDKLIFHADERWDEGKQALVNSGVWSINIGEDFVNGMADGGEEPSHLPIDLVEAYPAGSAKMDLYPYASAWKAKVGEKEIGSEVAVTCLQFRGESSGISAVNLALRKLAWVEASGNSEAVPEDPSLATIEQVIKVSPPADLSTWENDCVEEHSTRMTVVTNEHDVICVSVDSMTYLGGAHGVDGSGYHSYDATTGQEMKLAELVKPGFEERWAELGAAALRRQAGLKPDAKLTECGLFEDSLALNANFFVTPGGIGFCYNPYEIAAFARGSVEFVLPWQEIVKDLKPGTRAVVLAEAAGVALP